jgi:peptidoglycan/LPS O-acetylase OafA/YrhL
MSMSPAAAQVKSIEAGTGDPVRPPSWLWDCVAVIGLALLVAGFFAIGKAPGFIALGVAVVGIALAIARWDAVRLSEASVSEQAPCRLLPLPEYRRPGARDDGIV